MILALLLLALLLRDFILAPLLLEIITRLGYTYFILKLLPYDWPSSCVNSSHPSPWRLDYLPLYIVETCLTPSMSEETT
jgi:hypothetical protein